MNKTLDFRSDTVTHPTPAMREAIMKAVVGDDVYGEDPTVNALEEFAADSLGFEAALFGVSGTQTNLLAFLSHCQRGEEAIVGQQSHGYLYEAGGMAVLGSVQPQPLPNNKDGSIDLDALEAAIKPDDSHHAITRLIALENTFAGRVLPHGYVLAVRALADRHGLSMHLDGARLFNAAVATATRGEDALAAARSIVEPFDSVSLCLSKGLGAPLGSLLLGNAAFVGRARRLRKMIGGGMRQAGIVAAAGRYAIENHVGRMAEDHANAVLLAEGLRRAGNGMLTVEAPQTNMVWVQVRPDMAEAFSAQLEANAIRVHGLLQQRWVTHLDIDRADVERVVEVVGAACAKAA
jgi:threonine aldolase